MEHIEWSSILTNILTAGVGTIIGSFLMFYREWGKFRRQMRLNSRVNIQLLRALRSVQGKSFNHAVRIRVMEQRHAQYLERQRMIMTWLLVSADSEQSVSINRELAVVEAELKSKEKVDTPVRRSEYFRDLEGSNELIRQLRAGGDPDSDEMDESESDEDQQWLDSEA